MRDLTDQLADYFDATVERITAEDVLAGRQVRPPAQHLHQPIRKRMLRPAWALSVAFVTTIVVFGGSLGFGLLLRGERGDVGAGSAPATGIAAQTSRPWFIAIVIAIVVLLAAVAIVVRSNTRNRGENGRLTMTTTTTERPAAESRVHGLRMKNRVLVLAVIVLTLLAIGLGVWAISEATSADEVATVPNEVAELIDDWYAANDRGDGSVVDLYILAGYHLNGTQRFTGEEIASHLTQPGWTSEWITEPYLIVDEGDGRYVVTRGIRNSAGGASFASALTFEIVTTPSDELKFAQTAWSSVSQP